MLRHLALLAEQKWFMLDGYDILVIMDEIIKSKFSEVDVRYPKEGDGSVNAPFRMNSPAQWRYICNKKESSNERYYRIGGRFIHKDRLNYTSDRGLVHHFDEGGSPVTRGGLWKRKRSLL